METLNLLSYIPDQTLNWNTLLDGDTLSIIPSMYGCYMFVDGDGNVLYVGSATAAGTHHRGLRIRLKAHKRQRKFSGSTLKVWWCEDQISPLAYEYATIRIANPSTNRQANCSQTRGFRVSHEHLQELLSKYGQQATTDVLNSMVTDQRVPLPVPNLKLHNARVAMQNLARCVLTGDIVPSSALDNPASAFFHDHDRWTTGSCNEHSPDQLWANPRLRRRIFRTLIAMKMGEVSPATCRNAIALSGRVVSQFRPAAAKWLIDRYQAKSVLDPSAGWGDRLAGFWASSADHYTGIDPSTRRHPCYQQQVSLYSTLHKKDSRLICMPFEDWVPDREFDLGFTSPPYFNVETYSAEPTQSFLRYPTYQLWLEGFLRPFIKIQKSCCKRLAVNVAEQIKSSYGVFPLSEDLLRIAAEENLTLEETLKYPIGNVNGGKRHENIFVFV